MVSAKQGHKRYFVILAMIGFFMVAAGACGKSESESRNIVESAKETVQNVGDTAKTITEKTKAATKEVVEKASDVVETAKDKAEEAVEKAEGMVESAKEEAADIMGKVPLEKE